MIYAARLERNHVVLFAVDGRTVERLAATDDLTDLARSLLADARGSEPSPDVCRQFVQEVLSRVPHGGFVLPRETVNAWLRRAVTTRA